MGYKIYAKRCPDCKENLESTHRDDFKVCGCRTWCCVDGGTRVAGTKYTDIKQTNEDTK